MASDASSREARRRRIVDRGTDRLALITGRIQSLPDATPSSPPRLSQSPDAVADQPIPATTEKSVKVEESPFSEHEFTYADAQSSKTDSATAIQSHIPDPKPSNMNSENFISESSERPQSALAHSVPRTAHISPPKTRMHGLPFTPRQLSASVSETEPLRNFCSFVFSCLVVLSYAGFPILRCSLIKKVLFIRPLFLLLLTNITIMVAPLLKEQQVCTERRPRESDDTSGEGPGMADQLGSALEIGLLVHNVIGALFMDCSIYSVIVICGLSLFQ